MSGVITSSPKVRGTSTSAIVLAAGASTRMGMIKQLLRMDGRPLLQHVLDHVRASEVSQIVLVLGASADAIQGEIEVQGVRVVVNENYAQGMGTSLRAGLSAVVPLVRQNDHRRLGLSLGNSHGAPALALSFDSPRELAGAKGGRRAV